MSVESGAGAVVKRTLGFGRGDREYTAEVTVKVADGLVTVRESSTTAGGAMLRARAAAGRRLTARKRALGFGVDGYRETASGRKVALGFA